MLLLLTAAACSSLTTQSPPDVDLSGTWVIDARHSDSPPPMGQRDRSGDDERDRSEYYGGAQAPMRFDGPLPLLPMVSATEMTIGQDDRSMGIEYPGQPYRDIKWGEQKRGLFKIYSGWEERRLIIETKSEPLAVRETYALSDAGDTLTLQIELVGKRIGERHITRVFTRKPAPTDASESAQPH